MPVTGEQQLLKQLSRMALVRQVAARLGYTKSTVSLLVRELMDEGWLAERELLVTGEVGRRATPLHLDPSRLALLGAEVGVHEVRTAHFGPQVVAVGGAALARYRFTRPLDLRRRA